MRRARYLAAVGWAWGLAALAPPAPAAEDLRVDPANKTVTFSGRIARYDQYPDLKGAIEYGLVVAKAGKAYESVIESDVAPQALYDALKSLGAKPGAPASRDEGNRLIPPKGGWVAVRVEWSADGKPVKARLEEMIIDNRTKKAIDADAWVFVGSIPHENPATEKTELMANATKNLLSIHQSDRSVLLQNPVSEPAGGSSPYLVNKALVPKQGTAVTVTLSLADPAVAGARRMHARVKGRVQGVGFRDFTSRNAADLGLTGWVRNLPDGDVELIAEGPAAALELLAVKLMQGPPASKVENVFVLSARAGAGEFKSFEVRH